LEEHIRQYIEGQAGDQVVFSWQGGEPSQLGLRFFERIVHLQQKYRKSDQRIENHFQANDTLLDEDWAAFLKKHNFLVDLSCDGPGELHDHYRLIKGGKPTFDQVLATAKLLKRHKVPLNARCDVNRLNSKHGQKVYRFLTRELGVWRVQFMPCVQPKNVAQAAPQRWDPASLPIVGTAPARPGSEDSIVTDWSVDPGDWGQFLCDVWDDWYRRDYRTVHVNWFQNVIAQSLGLGAQMCVTSEVCGKGLAVEHNGDVFSCDHYIYPEYKLGNIRDRHLAEIAYSSEQKAFGVAKRDTLPDYCRACTHLKLCRGECPKNRLIRSPDGEIGLNYLCSGFMRFFTHIQSDMLDILPHLRRAQGRSGEPI
jgi:uncharacterized protein